MLIPTKEQCLKILKDNNVPDNIIAHSKKVCEVALKLADLLEKRGINADKDLVMAGALLHDIKKVGSKDHVLEGAEFVKSMGFPEVGSVIKKHGLQNIDDEEFIPKTWEEKIIFYADKRVKNDRLVSLQERFEYVKQRYDHYDVEKELEFTKKIENELLRDEKIY